MLFPFLLFGQNQQFIDSLKKELQLVHNIEKKTELNFLIGRNYLHYNIDSSQKYALNALLLLNKAKSQKISGKVYSLLGDIAVNRDSLDVAKQHYNFALTEYEMQNDTEKMVVICTVLGNIAFEQDNYSEAFNYYQKGVSLAKQGNYQKRLHRLYLNIGSILTQLDKNLEGQEYFSKSLNYFLDNGDSIETAIAYNNLGNTYIYLGDFVTASDYLNKAVEINLKKKAFINLSAIYIDLSEISLLSGDEQKAKDYLLEAIDLIEKNSSEQFEGPKSLYLSSSFIKLGRIYSNQQNNDSALYFLKTGLQIANQNNQLKELTDATRFLAKTWQNKHNNDSALFYHIQFKTYSDSLFKQMNSRKLAYQEAQFNFEQQLEKQELEREREIAKHNRNILILIVTIIILSLIIVVLGLFHQLSRIKIKKADIEQQNLKREIELKNKELTTYLIYQVKNNEFTLNITEKLKTLLWKGTAENKTLVNELIREIETDSSADNWDEFIVRFQQVHTGFYNNLGKKHPELTSNELRLCAFLKLNMNTKDIAAITYQSQKSITVARWRLRQKLGLKKEERLSAFLAKF